MLSKEVKNKLMEVTRIGVKELDSNNAIGYLVEKDKTYENEKKQLTENNGFFFHGLGKTYVNGVPYQSHNMLTIYAESISAEKLYTIIKNGISGTYLIVDNYQSVSTLTTSEIKKLLSLNNDNRVVMLGRASTINRTSITCNIISEQCPVTINNEQDIMEIIRYFEDFTYDTNRSSSLTWLYGFIVNLYFCVENNSLDIRKYIGQLCGLLYVFMDNTKCYCISGYIAYYFIRAAVYDTLVSIVTSNSVQIEKKLEDLSKLLNQIDSSVKLTTFKWNDLDIITDDSNRDDYTGYKVFKNNKEANDAFSYLEKLHYKREMLGLKGVKVKKGVAVDKSGHAVASLYAKASELNDITLMGGNSFVYCLVYSEKPVSITIKDDINLIITIGMSHFVVTTNYLDILDVAQKHGNIKLSIDSQLKRKMLSRFISTLKYRSTIAPYTRYYIEWLMGVPEHTFMTSTFEDIRKALVCEYNKLKERA